MKYEDALKAWGAEKLYCPTCKKYGTANKETVKAEFIFDEGFACCGGRDPDCMCSYAEPPRADILIVGECNTHGIALRYSENAEYFDFTATLKEIVEAGKGTVTA